MLCWSQDHQTNPFYVNLDQFRDRIQAVQNKWINQSIIHHLWVWHLLIISAHSLVFPERVFYLCAKSGVEADEWIKILRWKMVSLYQL